MTTIELARILKDSYGKAPTRDKAVHVVLFGIKSARELEAHSIAEISELSGIGKWGSQISLGRKLADFVRSTK